MQAPVATFACILRAYTVSLRHAAAQAPQKEPLTRCSTASKSATPKPDAGRWCRTRPWSASDLAAFYWLKAQPLEIRYTTRDGWRTREATEAELAAQTVADQEAEATALANGWRYVDPISRRMQFLPCGCLRATGSTLVSTCAKHYEPAAAWRPCIDGPCNEPGCVCSPIKADGTR